MGVKGLMLFGECIYIFVAMAYHNNFVATIIPNNKQTNCKFNQQSLKRQEFWHSNAQYKQLCYMQVQKNTPLSFGWSSHIDLQDSALTPKEILNLHDCQYRISDSPFVMLGSNTYVLFSIPPFL